MIQPNLHPGVHSVHSIKVAHYSQQKKRRQKPPLFCWYRYRTRTHLNATARWAVAQLRLDEVDSLIFALRAKMQIESGCRHHNPTLTLIEFGWYFSFLYLIHSNGIWCFQNISRENTFRSIAEPPSILYSLNDSLLLRSPNRVIRSANTILRLANRSPNSAFN